MPAKKPRPDLLDFQPFERWWLKHDYFPSGLGRLSHPLWKPYRVLYRSSVNPKDLTLIEELRLCLQGYRIFLLHMALKSKTKSKKTSNPALFLRRNERLIKLFGHMVAVEVWRELVQKCGSLTLGEALAFEANMEANMGSVINHAFQTAIEISQDVDSENPKDNWETLVREVTPMVPKLTGLLLKYHPGLSRSSGRTPQQWQTFILLAIVNYLEQKTQQPHYREAVDILNANVAPRLKNNDKLSRGSARARVSQFKKDHLDWHSDVETLYGSLELTNRSKDSALLVNPTC
jgi:hypothetical protein